MTLCYSSHVKNSDLIDLIDLAHGGIVKKLHNEKHGNRLQRAARTNVVRESLTLCIGT